jgi:hypothetical protein
LFPLRKVSMVWVRSGGLSARMEYRGKQYSVVLSIGGKWKWSVEIDGHTKSGRAPNRLAGIKVAKAEIDRALARKKKRPVPPAR